MDPIAPIDGSISSIDPKSNAWRESRVSVPMILDAGISRLKKERYKCLWKTAVLIPSTKLTGRVRLPKC